MNPTVMWATREHRGHRVQRPATSRRERPSTCCRIRPNTDPLAIGAGQRFDITAERPAHFGFGGGAHHCIGHWLARIDMREALPLIARRMRNPRYERPPVVRPVSGLTGPVELHIEFDAEVQP